MFGLYFGHYLSEHGIVPEADIAKIAALPYPAFTDELVGKKLLTRDEALKHLSEFKAEYDLSDDDVEAINSGDLKKIIPVFIFFDASEAVDETLKVYQRDSGITEAEVEKLRSSGEYKNLLPGFIYTDPVYYNRFVGKTIEGIIRCISDKVILKKAYAAQKFDFEHLACQELKGEHRIFLGISGSEDSLHAVAGKYAKRELPKMIDAAYEDSLCEFINCINGLYASELSNENIRLEISLPAHGSDKTLVSESSLYCLPVTVDGVETVFIFSFDNNVSII
ncbi:MAG: chemotaxis protein CheX [Oscillospiraceae bacterium]|nr:chemotaxis protein CheX [Oscillospiraceae bacterium]